MEKIETSVNKPISFSNSLKELESTKIKFYNKVNILEFIAERLNNSNINFKDNKFMPGSDSLYGLNKTRQNIEIEYEGDLTSLDKNKSWANSNDIFDSIIICQNDFSPFDIVQGSLSNCYYLSALAAIAKYPYLILNLFVILDIEGLKKIIKDDKKLLSDPKIINEFIIDFSLKLNKSNYYELLIRLNEFYCSHFNSLKCFIMKIRLHGEWKYIILDGYLPTFENSPSLIFAKSNSSDLWVSLLEKVWAKVLGGYYETSLGSPAEGFLSLTDSPTDVFKHSHLYTADALWDKINLSMKREWILACIIQLKGTKTKNYRNIGLITNHCYSIIRLVQTSVNGLKLKLVLLRNPHGNTNYSGCYSDDDPKWTEKLKKAADFDNRDAGCFFMSLEDYFKLFDHTFVCKHEQGKIYKSYKVNKTNCAKGSLFLIKIKIEGDICFTLHPKYKRVYRKGIKNKLAGLIIARIINYEEKLNNNSDFKYEYVAGSNGSKSVNVSAYFKTGVYLLYSRIETGIEKKLGFVISTYSDKLISDAVTISLFNNTPIIHKKFILEKILILMCRNNLNKDFYPKESEINLNCKDGNLSYKLATLNECDNGFGVIYLENKNTQACINTTIIIKDFTGLEFLDFDNKNKKQISIVTNPSSENLVLFKKMKMKCGFKISISETFSYSINYLKSVIKSKGEKKEILLNKAKSGVVIYSISHGGGYLFQVENTSKKNALVKIIFTKIENLTSKSITKGNYEENIKLNSSTFFDLEKIENNKPISIVYKYAVSLK